MREFKGTKGPWKWVEQRGYHTLIGGDGQDNLDNEVIDDGSAGGEYMPFIDINSDDAKLIAAAPELLDALNIAVGYLSEEVDHQSSLFISVIDKCNEAINKALGVNDA